MTEVSGDAAAYNKNSAIRRYAVIGAVWIVLLSGCGGGLESEPLVEYSTEINVQGSRPQTLSRQLRAGVYLVEVRERDIDLRVQIDSGETRVELADAFLRHGIHRTVVSLEQSSSVRITLNSIDQRTWRGAAAVRILRWPRAASGAGTDERLLGFIAQGKASELVAHDDKQSWQAALQPMREAVSHFEAAGDIRSLAEVEYQMGSLQHMLLYDYEDARRTAESAQGHFATVDDEVGLHRAALLRGMAEYAIASSMGPEVPRAEQREVLDRAATRAERAREFFAERQMATDEITALNRTSLRPLILGDFEACADIYQQALDRAVARHDKYFEAGFTTSLGFVAARRGDATRAVKMYERALPLIERDRNPDMYATIIANLGHSLVTLGEFDRALMLHSEALEVFSSRGDDSQPHVNSLHWRRSSFAAATWNVRWPPSKARCRCTSAPRITPARCRRGAWRVTRPQNSNNTTALWNTCAWPKKATATASPSSARAS